MQQIQNLVKELGVARLTNSVYVGTMKFTVDEVSKFVNGPSFTTDEPAPELLRKQLQDTMTAYDTLNEAYAVTLRSAISDEIAELDGEGDQLIYAVKGIVEAALRMAFDETKVQKAQIYNEFLKKYKIDPQENLISEWAKVQQACEEARQSAKLTKAEEVLGITTAMDRLEAIADTIRRKISERAAQLPDLQQMKTARATMDPEYRTLILILNSFAITAPAPEIYAGIIRTLNDNINYVRIHAMTKPSAGSGDKPTPEPEPTPDPEPEEQQEKDE